MDRQKPLELVGKGHEPRVRVVPLRLPPPYSGMADEELTAAMQVDLVARLDPAARVQLAYQMAILMRLLE